MATVCCKSEAFGSGNNISTLPRNLTGKILDCLSVREAVNCWTKLSHLKFDNSFFWHLRCKVGFTSVSDYLRTINRVLLHHDGTISKFFLGIPHYISLSKQDLDEISQWFILLSRKGSLKEFTFLNNSQHPKLPVMFLSCRDLTHLNLQKCTFYIPPASTRFPYLKSLEFSDVKFDPHIFLNFVSRSSLLERLDLNKCKTSGSPEDSLALTLKDSILRRLPGALNHLKILKLSYLDFLNSSHVVLFSLTLIRFSQNVQELHVFVNDRDFAEEQEVDAWRADCTMKHLHTIHFEFVSGFRAELKLLKFLLACSPSLEKLYVHRDEAGNSSAGYKIVIKLISFPRASPKAKILFSDSSLEEFAKELANET